MKVQYKLIYINTICGSLPIIEQNHIDCENKKCIYSIVLTTEVYGLRHSVCQGFHRTNFCMLHFRNKTNSCL